MNIWFNALDRIANVGTDLVHALDKHRNALDSHTAATTRLARTNERLASIGETLVDRTFGGQPQRAETQEERSSSDIRTLRQAAADIGMDLKTLRKRMAELKILGRRDGLRDGRAIFLTEDDIHKIRDLEERRRRTRP